VPFCEIAQRETLLRDTNAERQRMTLTHLISEGFKGWHGVKLHQPDWSDRSHSIAFSAELVKEDILVFAIFNAYGGAASLSEYECRPLSVLYCPFGQQAMAFRNCA
jgi:hypothetical protein